MRVYMAPELASIQGGPKGFSATGSQYDRGLKDREPIRPLDHEKCEVSQLRRQNGKRELDLVEWPLSRLQGKALQARALSYVTPD